MTRTVRQPAVVSIRVNRSEFLAEIIPAGTETAFSEHWKSLKKKHHAASHVCWAYRIQGISGLEEQSSDAGEPAGTAGLPLLNILRSKELVNCALFVVRYFGGVKLGRRGLAEAYVGAGVAVLEAVKLIPFEPRRLYVIECPLEYYGDVARALDQNRAHILKDLSAGGVRWLVEIPAQSLSALITILRDITHGTVLMKKEEQA